MQWNRLVRRLHCTKGQKFWKGSNGISSPWLSVYEDELAVVPQLGPPILQSPDGRQIYQLQLRTGVNASAWNIITIITYIGNKTSVITWLGVSLPVSSQHHLNDELGARSRYLKFWSKMRYCCFATNPNFRLPFFVAVLIETKLEACHLIHSKCIQSPQTLKSIYSKLSIYVIPASGIKVHK